jgi:rod shape-determining protein MreD
MRSAITIIVGLLLLLLQSTVMEFAPMHLVTPSLGLLVVLYVGMAPLKWAPGSAVVVGFGMGYLFDLVSGAPRGVHAFVFVTLALIARVLAWRLAVRGIVLKAATAFVASMIAAFLIVVVRAQISPESGYGGLRQAPLESLLTAAFGPPVLWLLARLDGRLDPALLRVGLARRRARALGQGMPHR